MFERRIKITLTILLLVFLILLARLADLQVLHAEQYQTRAEKVLLTRPRPIPAVRGAIRDRTGEVLVCDEPAWSIQIEFEVIAADIGADPQAMSRLVRRCKRSRRYPQARTPSEIEALLRLELRQMWGEIAELERGEDEIGAMALQARAREIYEQITALRTVVAARRGFDGPVAEETAVHEVVGGLNAAEQIRARERLGRYPWVSIAAVTRRTFAHHTEPFAHLLGRLGRVSAEQIAADPEADDPFARYLADERFGVSGVEALMERALRGRRGQIVLNRNGQIAEEPIEPQDGGDVTLTLHGELQRRLYALLDHYVRGLPDSPGGAIVVLDVASREVLALVSYPAFDPNQFDELYSSLRDDTDRLPLRFRAVANRYPPGSLVKPLIGLAGLVNGRITLETHEECNGYLIPEQPDRWRCWEMHGTRLRKAHGSIELVQALTGSCNVFFYRLGERLGVDAIGDAFDMAGMGRPTGMGLREESRGINPTPAWLAAEKGSGVHAAHARLFAIGQGEVAVTPLQAANLAAIYASGRFRPVTLIRDGSPRPEWILPGKPEHWAAIRQGIFGVVNDPDGTAHEFIQFEHERYALCGKTGSATAYARPVAYHVPFTDPFGIPGVAMIRAGSKSEALRRFEAENPGSAYDPSRATVAETWPKDAAGQGPYAHAWFAGFLQEIDAQRRPVWSKTPRFAFALLIEFGGSGGRTGGPLARQIAHEILSVLEAEP
jgi:penicillin-binding protein 2